jgi:hypothetical protein
MGLAHFPQPPPIDVRSAACAGWRPLVCAPNPRHSSVRKPGPPPSDRDTPALSQEATEADCGRPHSVGLAVRSLERLAICPRHRQARNCHCMAPEGLSPFLDMEDPTRPSRTASSSKRGPRSDPQDESRESALGCSPHSRRTAQTGHRHRRDQRRPVHAASTRPLPSLACRRSRASRSISTSMDSIPARKSSARFRCTAPTLPGCGNRRTATLRWPSACIRSPRLLGLKRRRHVPPASRRQP